LIRVPRGAEATYWDLQPSRRIGISRSGYRLRLNPFMGIMGMPLDQPGIQSTFPPTACGGNLDCKDLIAGSTLFLPIAVAGGLFFTGDGHAVQGDGEVAGPALNCPMEVELEFSLRGDLALTLPRARTREGWLTFGFHQDLDEAAAIATVEMLKLMGELYRLSSKDALSLASLVVHLRVTQMVNGVRGIHAVLPHGALRRGIAGLCENHQRVVGERQAPGPHRSCDAAGRGRAGPPVDGRQPGRPRKAAWEDRSRRLA
jgi:acetamidase/formamidase